MHRVKNKEPLLLAALFLGDFVENLAFALDVGTVPAFVLCHRVASYSCYFCC